MFEVHYLTTGAIKPVVMFVPAASAEDAAFQAGAKAARLHGEPGVSLVKVEEVSA